MFRSMDEVCMRQCVFWILLIWAAFSYVICFYPTQAFLPRWLVEILWTLVTTSFLVELLSRYRDYRKSQNGSNHRRGNGKA
jgi:hypothetical protein